MSTIDERIAGLITLTESHTRMMENLAALSEQNTQAIVRLEQSVETLVNVATNQQAVQEQHQRNFETIVLELQRQGTDIREMQVEIRELRVDVREIQAEVRGLQTENRRILDHLINPENS